MTIFSPCVNDSRVIREATTLLTNGHEVTVFAIERAPYKADPYDDPIPIVRLRMPKRWGIQNVIGYFQIMTSYCVKLFLALRAYKPDIIHCHDLTPLPLSALFARILGAKIIYDSHELWRDRIQENKVPDIIKNIGIYLEKIFVRRVHGVITVGDLIANDMRDNLAIRKPVVLRNIPPLKRHNGNPNDRISTFIRDLRPCKLVAVYHGAITKERGLSVLVQAMEHLRDPGIHCIIIGDGSFLDGLKILVTNYGLTGTVHIFPTIPYQQLVSTIKEADIGVHPILRTSLNHELCLPNKLFEYASAGLPIIASDMKEMGALIKSEKLGLTFKAGDSENLAQCIRTLTTEPESLADLKSSVQQVTANRLNWEIEERKLIQLYEEVFR